MIPYTAEEITVEWLTDVLYQNEVLNSGNVVSLKIRADTTTPFSNKIQFIDLTLSMDANPAGTLSLVYKAQEADREYYFYSEIIKTAADVPVLDLYLAHYNPQIGRSVLLFPDISKSHFQSPWPVPPLYDECKSAVTALARLHIAWWNHPHLAEAKKMASGEKSWTRRYQKAIAALPDFIAFLGNRISSPRRAIYESIIPVVELSFHQRQNATLIHGDAHLWNFLFPKDTKGGSVKILDWNSWDIGTGSDDLAYMMGLHWYPERRQRLERELLRTYHQTILKNGVQGYSLEDLWDDYRLSCIRNMLIPVWQWTRGIHPSVWWFHFERSFMTYNDLACCELLRRFS